MDSLKDCATQAAGAEYDRVADIARSVARLSDHDKYRLQQCLEREHRIMGGEKAACDTAEPISRAPLEYPAMRRAEELSIENIEDAMRYQPWDPDQTDRGEQVRDALITAAKTILRLVPRSPRRTKALQHLIDARMDANAAISFRGRF